MEAEPTLEAVAPTVVRPCSRRTQFLQTEKGCRADGGNLGGKGYQYKVCRCRSGAVEMLRYHDARFDVVVPEQELLHGMRF